MCSRLYTVYQLKHKTVKRIELKYSAELLSDLKSRIKYVGTGSVRVKGDIIIFTYNSNAILSSLIKRKDIAVTENNIQTMAKCLMF